MIEGQCEGVGGGLRERAVVVESVREGVVGVLAACSGEVKS